MLGDTIFAVASPPGGSARAVLRISGPDARAAAAAVFAPAVPAVRGATEGALRLGDEGRPGGGFAAFALSMPGPRSYTGEDVVELHVPGSPVLCAWLGERMAEALPGRCRAAAPGEFTARAVQNGKLDLAQAEGVLMLIHGESEAQAARGIAWLRGGLSEAVAQARAALEDALALVEVGLDFETGETGEVPVALVGAALARGEAALAELSANLPAARRGGDLLLLGRSNAGKSSLANALAGEAVVIVDAARGTTRDVVRVPTPSGVCLWDGPGDLEAPGDVDEAALQARDRLASEAGGLLFVVDPDDVPEPVAVPRAAVPVVAIVFTKGDRRQPTAAEVERARAAVRADASAPVHCVSSITGAGLEALRSRLSACARGSAHGAGAPLQAFVAQALASVRRAAAGSVPELVGQELRDALRALDGIDGRSGVEGLLDRIYGRFCLGK